MIETINKNDANTGTHYAPPARPAQCPDSDVLAAIKNVGDSVTRKVRDILNKIAEDTGESALQNAEITAEFGKEMQRVWDKTPEPVQVFIVSLATTAGCTALVALAVKTTVATGGAAAPAWVSWAIGGGAGVCSATVAAALVAFGNGHPSGNDNGESDDGDESKTEDDDSGIPGDFNRNGRIDDDDVDKATQMWLAGQIDKSEFNRIQNERDCADGWADACEALGR